MNAYRVLSKPIEADKWMLPEVSGDTHFLEGDEDGEVTRFCVELSDGPDRLIAFNIGKRIHIETFPTVKCYCGTLFVTEEEMEKHL